MKRIALAFALIVAVSLRGQAPEPARLPGEPHHHLKIDNEYVRAYYVEVAPHEATRLHQHDHDYIFASLGAADIINAPLNKPELHQVLKDGEIHFARGPFAHVARNLADTPFRNVTIEFLKPQGEMKNLCAQIVANTPGGDCAKTVASGRNGQGFSVEPQMETPETKLDLVQLGPETKFAAITVPGKSLVVALSDSEVQIEIEGEAAKILHGGEMAWIAAGSHAGVSNPARKASSYLQLSFGVQVAAGKP